MKRLKTLIALCILAGVTGCNTLQTEDAKRWTCQTAEAAYVAYQAAVAAGMPQQPEEIYAAAAAGAFLRLWCGWSYPTPKGFATTVLHDTNGVPVLTR